MNTDAPRPNISPSSPNAGAMSAAIARHHQRVDSISPPAASSSSIHQQESSSLKTSSLEKDTTKCAPRSRSSSTSSSHGSAASVPSRIGALPSTSSTGTKKDEEKTLTQPDDKEDVPETENAPSSSVPPCTHANEMLTSSSSSSSLASSGAGTGATAATILAPRKRELHYFSDQYRGWLNLLLDDISDSETDNDDDDEMDAEQEQQQRIYIRRCSYHSSHETEHTVQGQ